MSDPVTERLYHLLPTIYRQRDAASGEPLRALLAVIEAELQTIEADIGRLYDNWFIETCDEWLVPYLADLLGIRDIQDEEHLIVGQRARVANTIRHRRRKGTLATLEQVAGDTSGWHVRAVEFFERLAATQHVAHPRPGKGATLDLRDVAAMAALSGPFETAAHMVDVRRMAPGQGKYNIPNVGLFVWRLHSYNIADSPARKVREGCYTFHPLGYDMPLFNRPLAQRDVTAPAKEIDLPGPLQPLALAADLTGYGTLQQATGPANPSGSPYYGRYRSLNIANVPLERILPQDLSGWKRPPEGKVAVDVRRGRLAFPEGEEPTGDVRVTYTYGFSGDVGGGPYDRHDTLSRREAGVQVSAHGPVKGLQDALKSWQPQEGSAWVVRILDNGRYELPQIELQRGAHLVIEAADGQRPVLGQADRLKVVAPPDGAALTLNGLLIEGGLEVQGALDLTISHCTVIPPADQDGRPPATQSSVLEVLAGSDTATRANVTITHSVVGPLRLPAQGGQLTIRDSILDPFGLDGALAIADAQAPASGYGPPTSLERVTVLGRVRVREMPLASEVIFSQPITVERRQSGCIRYSYVPQGSQTPPRYRCQPDLALARAAREKDLDGAAERSTQERDALTARIRPAFTAVRYAQPGYVQLSQACAAEIRTGAEDEAEMGAFAHLKQPQRLDNLETILEAYLRSGLEAGVYYVT